MIKLTLQSSEIIDGKYIRKHYNESWDPTKTAVIISDMWDQHWCISATKNVAEMAPRMNEMLCVLRKKGVQIVHAPSETMNFYEDIPQYKNVFRLAEGIELVAMTEKEEQLKKEPGLLFGDKGLECDCGPIPCINRKAWSKQINTLKIEPEDLLGDSIDVLKALKAKGIENVIITGVHTNMCVIGRYFGIRNLVRYGFNTVLTRDLTDCRVPHGAEPFKHHYTSLDYVVWYVEKYLCPTVVSGELIGDGKTFRFEEDDRSEILTAQQLEDTMNEWKMAMGGEYVRKN